MPKELPIILVNYNGNEDTIACLQSILYTEMVPLPFVIVVDNASYGKVDEIINFYPKIHIIKNKENLGFGKANNIGINWAIENLAFDYLLLLNNDTLIEKDSLYYLLDAFSKSPEIGIATSKIMYEKDREIVWYGGGDINYKRGWPKIANYNQIATPNGANKSRFVTFVSGCVMMFSKKCLEKVGGFDDEFFMYCEDLELSLRVINLGFKLYYEPKSIIYHKVEGSINKLDNNPKGIHHKNPSLLYLFYHVKSNQYLAMKKNLPLRDFLLFYIVYWLEFTYIVFAKILIHGKFKIIKIVFKTIKRIIKAGG